MIIYSVVITDGYIPHIPLATTNREEALKFAKGWAKGWKYGHNYGDEYFRQEEDGSMEYSVTVIKAEIKISVGELYKFYKEAYLTAYGTEVKEA